MMSLRKEYGNDASPYRSAVPGFAAVLRGVYADFGQLDGAQAQGSAAVKLFASDKGWERVFEVWFYAILHAFLILLTGECFPH
jgi:hypothetical protein